MAHIIPYDLARAALAGAKHPGLETLRALKDALLKVSNLPPLSTSAG